MHQTTLEPTFLHVYNVESELWVPTELVSPVSSRILEAMNLILDKDGILAFIGTREEFGTYVTELSKETEGGTARCWTSLPTHIIMSMLGLCLNTAVLGKPEMAFYGSPLTLSLAVTLEFRARGEFALWLETIRERPSHQMLDGALIWHVDPATGESKDFWLSADEKQESLHYIPSKWMSCMCKPL